MMVVMGVGSPLLSDDGAAHRVIDLLEGKLGSEVRLIKTGGDPICLMDGMAGCSGAVIVDAIADSSRMPGEVVCSGVEGHSGKPWGSHGGDVPGTLAIGRSMGIDLPEEKDIHLVGIVAMDVAGFGEELSREVEAALPEACSLVIECLERIQRGVPATLRGSVNLQPQGP